MPAAMQPTLEESNSRWWNKVTWMNMSLAWSSGLSSKYKLTKPRVTVSEGAFYLVSHINIVDVSDRDFTCSVVDCFHTLFLSSPTNGWPGSFKYRQRRFTSCSRCSETSILAKRIINNSISGDVKGTTRSLVSLGADVQWLFKIRFQCGKQSLVFAWLTDCITQCLGKATMRYQW